MQQTVQNPWCIHISDMSLAALPTAPDAVVSLSSACGQSKVLRCALTESLYPQNQPASQLRSSFLVLFFSQMLLHQVLLNALRIYP